ncbi:MAG: DUF3592 domain-containing protein [Planctomycetota bacterium]
MRSMDLDQQIMELLLAGKRAQALLVLYRTHGGSLDEAWETINQLGDELSYQIPIHDSAHLTVKQYLEDQDRPTSWKETASAYMIGLFVIAIGLGMVALAWPRFKTGFDSYWWQKHKATVLMIHLDEENKFRQQRQVTQCFLSYRYRYQFDGQAYENTVRKEPFYDVFGDRIYDIGEQIDVVVNPWQPEQSIHKRFMYQRTLWVVVGIGIIAPGAAWIAFLMFLENNFRKLRCCDPLLKTNGSANIQPSALA